MVGAIACFKAVDYAKRMKRHTIGVSCAALGLALGLNPAAVRADDNVALVPAGEWKLRASPDKCRLSRGFGEGENTTSLRIDQGGIEPYYTLTIVGRPVRNPYGNVVQVRFGPDEQATHRGYISAKSAGGKPALVMYGVLLAPMSAVEAREGTISSIGEQRETAIE